MTNNEESRLLEYAKREFLKTGYAPIDEEEDGPNKWIQENVLELLEVFARQGHSGMSAAYCVEAFARLARYEPLCALTGDDDEWQDVGEGMFQNIRCTRVFKDASRFNGQAYDVEGIVWRDPDGTCYSNYNSAKVITFPYLPTREYVDVGADGKWERDSTPTLTVPD